MEIGLLIDCTNSMSSWIIRTKDTLRHIIELVQNQVKEEIATHETLDFRVSFVGYKDILSPAPRFSVLEFTNDIKGVE